MSEIQSNQDLAYLHSLEQVASNYRHRQKQVTPGQALATESLYLKWYDVAYEDTLITADQVEEARSLLFTELETGALALRNELGFVVHHQCTSAYILYVCTWRNENEIWETLYVKDLAQDGAFQMLQRDATTPTFCVWVLGPVWHEQQAWTRYLYSQRDDAAKYAYTQDQMTGLV